MATSPPPPDPVAQIRLRAGTNSAIQHASQDWAVAQNTKLDAEARLRSLQGTQAIARLGAPPAVRASQDWAIAARDEMHADAKLAKLQGKAGGGSHKTFTTVWQPQEGPAGCTPSPSRTHPRTTRAPPLPVPPPIFVGAMEALLATMVVRGPAGVEEQNTGSPPPPHPRAPPPSVHRRR